MAYICNRKTPCSQCEHYKFDKKENQMACFAPKEMELADYKKTGFVEKGNAYKIWNDKEKARRN